MPCAEGEGTGWASARWLRFALLIAAALSAAAPAGVLAGDAVGAQEMPATAFPAADLQPPALPAGAAVPIALPLFSAQESARLADAQSESGPFRVGFGRSIPQPAAADAAPRWRALPDGRHAAVWRISSPGAVGLRLQLRVLKLPDSATLRFFGPGSERCQTITGASINASLRQDTAAGASGAAAQHYWSPLIQGDTLMLEIELPAGVDPRTVQIALPAHDRGSADRAADRHDRRMGSVGSRMAGNDLSRCRSAAAAGDPAETKMRCFPQAGKILFTRLTKTISGRCPRQPVAVVVDFPLSLRRGHCHATAIVAPES